MQLQQRTSQRDHDPEKEALIRALQKLGEHLSQGELLDLADAIHEIVRQRRGQASPLVEPPIFSSRDDGCRKPRQADDADEANERR